MEGPLPSWLLAGSLFLTAWVSTAPLTFLQDVVFGFPQSRGPQNKRKRL